MSGDGSFSDEDVEPVGKARPKGHLPYLPSRDASFSVLRQWVSNAIGLPPQVKVESVTRYGRDDDDSLNISLSNDVQIRCNRQKRLQSPGPFQAFFASESDGLCQPKYLSRAEVGDVFVALCRLGTADAAASELDILRERLDMFVAMCDLHHGSLLPQWRFVTISALKQRAIYDPKVPRSQPVLVNDMEWHKQLIRPIEFVAYLRVIHGQTVNESTLEGRMTEMGGARHSLQAWDGAREHKVKLVFYELPQDGSHE
jgi:hypothetical protein